MLTKEKLLENASALQTKYTTGDLSVGNKGYKLRYYDFVNVGYLFLQGVDVKNPDLLGIKNKNTFVTNFLGAYNKLNEQTRIDYKELNFIVDGESMVANFTVKSANQKVMTEDNSWTEVSEMVTDDANWYGSGYKKIWTNSEGIKKMVAKDPWELMWDLYDFKNSDKIEVLTVRPEKVWNNEIYKKFDSETIIKFKDIYKDEKDYIRLTQFIYKDGEDEKLAVLDLENELVLYMTDKLGDLVYVKYDQEKRRGFPDAPGRGMLEKIFNIIVSNKLAQKRLDEVMDITTKLLLEKVVSGDKDKIANRQVTNFKTGTFIPVKETGSINAINLGGGEQVNQLALLMGGLNDSMNQILGTPEVLSGDAKTLGANSSGKAIQSLAEYASSVHKDVKKRYARIVEWEYREAGMSKYILNVFKSTDDLTKYLSATNLSVLRRNIINFKLARKRIEIEVGMVDGEGYDEQAEKERLQAEIKKTGLFTKEVLENLRDDVKSIKVVVSGEQASKEANDAFISQIKAEYMANPQLMQDPTYIELTVEQGKNIGINELTIREFFRKLEKK